MYDFVSFRLIPKQVKGSSELGRGGIAQELIGVKKQQNFTRKIKNKQIGLVSIPSAGQTEEHRYKNDDPQPRSCVFLTLVCQLCVPSLLPVEAFQPGEKCNYWCLGKQAVPRLPGGRSESKGGLLWRRGRSPLPGWGGHKRGQSRKWLRIAHNCSPASLESCNTATDTFLELAGNSGHLWESCWDFNTCYAMHRDFLQEILLNIFSFIWVLSFQSELFNGLSSLLLLLLITVAKHVLNTKIWNKDTSKFVATYLYCWPIHT